MGKQYGLSRDSIYRHAHALGLMDKRRRNVRAALEKIIEKAGDVEVSATAVVSAVSPSQNSFTPASTSKCR
jgi:hypothetical protein